MPNAVDQEKMDALANSPVVFDQTKPPLKSIPLLEYPKTMYLWAKDKKIHPLHGSAIEKDSRGEFVTVTDFNKTDTARVKVAKDADEEKALRARGFRDKPHSQEFEEEVPVGFEADLPEGVKAKK